MGNTSSIPPPLVSINAPGNEVLVPYGTSLYACPPPTAGYHPPHTHCDSQRAARGGTACKESQHCQGAPQGPIFSKVAEGPRRRRHGYVEPDVKIREYEEESESTGLGERPARRKKGKMQDMRGFGGRGATGLYNVDPRPNSAPVGYTGLRGGQGHPGMYPGAEEMAMNGMMPYAGMQPGMYSGMYPGGYPQGPNVSPHPSMPPQYTAQAAMPGHPYGMGGGQIANAFPSHSPRPPPPSTASSTTSHKSRSKLLPSAIQAAIDEAIQKRNGTPKTHVNPLTRSKTSPATFAKDDNDGWGDGIDTCICTTNCKCRKGERGIKWYEGTAKIGGEDIPVRAKLNTRFILKDDLGKDCGDHSGCKKKGSSSSSSSDTEVSEKTKKKDKKKAKKAGKADQLNDLQAELDKMKQAAALKQGNLYGPSPFAGYTPANHAGYDPETMQRIMQMSDPYRIDRVGGMDATGKTPGMYDSMTTRNPRLPRMPPNPGMRMRSEDDGFAEHREDRGGASPLNPYAGRSAMGGKGRDQSSGPQRRGPRFSLRRDPGSDSEPSISNRSRRGKKGGLVGGHPRRSHAFELDDTDVSLAPRRRSAMRGFDSDVNEEHAMFNLPNRGNGGMNHSAFPREGWPRISSPGRRGGVCKGRMAGKQARVETDDEEDY